MTVADKLSSTLIAQQGISNVNGVANFTGLENMFANIVRVVMGLGGIVLFIMLIMGGFNYITSGGDPQKSAAARNTLTYAIVGFILMASALLIIRIIEEVTGVRVNLTLFQVVR